MVTKRKPQPRRSAAQSSARQAAVVRTGAGEDMRREQPRAQAEPPQDPEREIANPPAETERPEGDSDQRQPSRASRAQSRPSGRSAAGQQGGGNRRIKRTIASWRQYGVMAFGAIMLLGCVVGLIFFARPTISTTENRTLTQLPELTPSSFLDGSYFTQVSLWYADTYPLREPMVSAALGMNKLYGIEPDTRLIGGNRTSDELPTATSASDEKPTHEHNVAAPEARAAAADLESQITNGMYITDGACYTLYYFDEDATREYAGVINDAARLLDGKATVYSVLIPTNAGIMLDEETLKKLGVPNQDQAIDYFYSLMTDDVVTVPTFDNLLEHKDEYLYFRTDHHWTQLGAYYAYESFCKVKGIEPAPFFEWEELVFTPFWGEYGAYTDISNFEPDSVEARIPQGTNTMTYWTDDLNPSTETEGPIVADFSDMQDDDANKYNCFACGNQPMSLIVNPNVTDGSSCLIIKDSFGNPFVATMTDSYQYIYTIDFRFTSQKLLDLVEEYEIQDVIFENVIMFAGTYDCVNLLSAIVYPDDGSSSDEGSEASASSESSASSASAASSE